MIIISKDQPVVIGVDTGYGNIKTANTCFPTGVTAWDTEPTFKNDLLVYEGRNYTIGSGHKEYSADKIGDNDFYLLTLAAISRELNIRGMTEAKVFLGAGLPLTWVGKQEDEFKAYLLRNECADYTFRGKPYHVEFAGAEIFPQGFAAVANKLHTFRGTNILCDIGNGTMNILSIENGKPNPAKCYTEKFGTYQCTLAAKEALQQKLGKTVDEPIIEDVLRRGTADISESVLNVIRESTKQYVAEIMRRLREHGYDPELMQLYVMGGGSCLVKNFAEYDSKRVTINGDICATAKGYEQLAARQLVGKTGGGAK